MKKKINYLLIVEAVICILICIFGGKSLDFSLKLLAFPFETIAIGLRNLSFLGGIGNIFAWILFIVICGVPIIILMIKFVKKKFVIEDILLLVIGLIMLAAIYYMININTLASEMVIPVGVEGLPGVLGGVIYSVIAGYLIIKVVRRFAKADSEQLKRYFNNVLFGVNVVIIAVCFGISLNELLLKLDVYVNNNYGINENLMITKFFIVMEYVKDVIISMLVVGIVLLVQGLIEKLNIDNISDEVIKRAQVISKCCVWTIVIHTILSILYNVLQLIFIKKIYVVSSIVSIPVVIILFMLVIMIFTQLILKTKSIKEENDMFI